LTNDIGEYQLRNVPAGSATLQVSYTGIEGTTVQVTVGAGTTTMQDVTLAAGGSVGKDGTVMLDPFTIESGRFKNATDIAINEERYSVNIKNVVAADAFGDIPGGNVGEFIKFLPGVEITYGGTYTSETDASGISVRGFGTEDTAIYIDGVPISSASPASLSNAVGLDMMSINNASRVELVKVATPDMPNNSIGGSINLISKSAFEYSKPTVYWKAYLTVNSENLNIFKKTAGPSDEKVWASRPGFDLTYAHPINDRLGVSVTLSSFSQFSENRRFRPEFTLANVNNQTTNLDLRPFGGANGVTATNALGQISLANPFMNRISISDDPRYSTSNSASFKVDWRPLPGSVALRQLPDLDLRERRRRPPASVPYPAAADLGRRLHHLLPLCPAGPICQRPAVQSEQHLGHEHRLPRQGGHDPHRLAPGNLQEGSVGHLRSGQRLNFTRVVQGHRKRPLLDGGCELQRGPHRIGANRRRHSTKCLRAGPFWRSLQLLRPEQVEHAHDPSPLGQGGVAGRCLQLQVRPAARTRLPAVGRGPPRVQDGLPA
jgi:hypothetical protein